MWILWSGLALAADEPTSGDAELEASLAAWLVTEGQSAEEAAGNAASIVEFERSIAWQTGHVSVHDGALALELPEGDRYAPPGDASRILEAWGNPPNQETDGVILPAGAHLFGPTSWAVLLSFTEDGWVDDSDAASMDYDEILGQLREGDEAGNEERKRLGLSAVHLTGWAEAPHYDATTRVMYWATLLHAESGADTLNYDVRLLGRRGVFSMNALADPTAMTAVKQGMEKVRTYATFQPGHTYADYVPGTDTKAAYGIAALIAGGAVAAKTGVLKGLLAMLLAGKKLVVLAAAAAVTAVKSFFGGKSKGPPEPPPEA